MTGRKRSMFHFIQGLFRQRTAPSSYVQEEQAAQEAGTATEDVPAQIAVLGSCVTRDAFNFNDGQILKLNYYQARTSLISLMAPPCKVEESDLELPSAFQRRMVLNDCNKTFFRNIEAREPEYVILDLIDERLDVLKVGESFITRSREFVDSKLEKKLAKFHIFRKDEVIGYWETACEQFVQEITKLYQPSQIILHKAYYKDTYIDKNGEVQAFDDKTLQGNKRHNLLLRHFYEHLQSLLPDVRIIDLSDKAYHASENHVWGLSPFHYEDEYYKELMRRLYAITRDTK